MSSQSPCWATKVVIRSDKVTGGTGTDPEFTRMCEAMAASASMMNWASAMAIFISAITLTRRRRTVNAAIRSTSGPR